MVQIKNNQLTKRWFVELAVMNAPIAMKYEDISTRLALVGGSPLVNVDGL
jgi:hypothetical protein